MKAALPAPPVMPALDWMNTGTKKRDNGRGRMQWDPERS